MKGSCSCFRQFTARKSPIKIPADVARIKLVWVDHIFQDIATNYIDPIQEYIWVDHIFQEVLDLICFHCPHIQVIQGIGKWDLNIWAKFLCFSFLIWLMLSKSNKSINAKLIREVAPPPTRSLCRQSFSQLICDIKFYNTPFKLATD